MKQREEQSPKISKLILFPWNRSALLLSKSLDMLSFKDVEISNVTVIRLPRKWGCIDLIDPMCSNISGTISLYGDQRHAWAWNFNNLGMQFHWDHTSLSSNKSISDQPPLVRSKAQSRKTHTLLMQERPRNKRIPLIALQLGIVKESSHFFSTPWKYFDKVSWTLRLDSQLCTFLCLRAPVWYKGLVSSAKDIVLPLPPALFAYISSRIWRCCITSMLWRSMQVSPSIHQNLTQYFKHFRHIYIDAQKNPSSVYLQQYLILGLVENFL